MSKPICLVIAATAVLVICSRPLPAHAAPSVTVNRVSDQSPFAAGACLSDVDAALSPLGFNNGHGFENTPSFAVTPQGLVAAWTQDGGSVDGLGIVTAHSSDGGSTWAQSVPPALSICQSGLDALRVGDPRVVVDGNGTTFLSATAGEPDVRGTVMVSTSADGGATWSGPKTLNLLGLLGPNDYPTMSADPLDPHAVAIVWSEVFLAATWFARTTDDGATWSTPLPIRVTANTPESFNSLVTLPNGTLVDVFADGATTALLGAPVGGVVVGALRSTDHGSTWAETTIASLSAQGNAKEPVDPVVWPDGKVYVLLSDVDSGSGARVWKLFRSPDGAAWSEVATLPLRDDAFLGQLAQHVAITSDGTIGVLYDDHRNDVEGDPELTTDVWLTYSSDGGSTWSDLHLGGPFDLNTVPNGYVGDYEELHAVGADFGAVFALGAPAATEGPTDIFFARIPF
jgi:hypothetical protein